VNVADTVTALLGIENVHGLVEHEIPVRVDQFENCHPEEGVAVTVIGEPTPSEQPPEPGQFGLTEPKPASTPVIRVWVGASVNVASRVTAIFGIVKTQGFEEQEIPV
jgi:hypothetical protein